MGSPGGGKEGLLNNSISPRGLLEIKLTPDGIPTARIEGRYIHSRYNPLKEARQFWDHWWQKHKPLPLQLVVLFDPGLGYLLDLLRQNHDPSHILVFFYREETYQYCLQEGKLQGLTAFPPGEDLTPKARSLLESTPLGDILFLEYPPMEALCKERGEALRSNILTLLRIRQGNDLTQRGFARRWILNGLSNYLRFDYSSTLKPLESPVLLLSSGPSLAEHLGPIRRLQNNYILAALPSSLRLLQAWGIQPDILFSTDPGYYAREHLRYLSPRTLCISPLTATLSNVQGPLMGIHQGMYVDGLLFQKDEVYPFPEMGTVGGTALYLLSRFTRKSIYLVGFDLAMRDIEYHSRPHSFDELILKGENRLFPGYNAFYQRAAGMTQSRGRGFRLSRSMSTYAGWFNQQPPSSQIIRIAPSPVKLPFQSLPEIPTHPRPVVPLEVGHNSRYPSLGKRKNRLLELAQVLEAGLASPEPPREFLSFTKNFFPRPTLKGEKPLSDRQRVGIEEIIHKIRSRCQC